MKRLFLHYLAPHKLTPTDPTSITSMAYGKMFPLRPIQLFNLGIGCYAFCISNGQKVRPWYVGKTLAQGGFRDEVFTPHKILHYTEILNPQDKEKSYRRGKPCILLFPLVSDTWRLSKSRANSDGYVDWLETTLIGMALSQNPEIANTSKTRFHREVYVNGLIGGQYQGRPSTGANFARKAFHSA